MAEPTVNVAEDHEEPEVLTEEEKMANIRAVRFPVIPKYAEILQETYPLLVRKGAKEKTQLHESQIPHLMRSLAFNPSEEQIERLIANAKYKEKPSTQKQHYEYDNFEQRIMEYLFNEPDAFQRKSESLILEALLTISKGRKEMDAEELKTIMKTLGTNPFTEEEATNMLRVARDKDTGKVFLEEYCKILASDGLPPPIDPLEPIDDSFR